MNQTDQSRTDGDVSAKPDGRSTRHRDRRQEIAAAAIDYVFEHGLADLSVRPVAEAAGISHRTLLYHFGSKEALVSQVLKELRSREQAATVALLADAGGSPAELLDGIWNHFIPAHEDFMCFFFEVWGNALQHPSDYSEFLNDVVDGWLDVAEGALHGTDCAPEDVRPFATLMIAAVRGLIQDLLTTNDHERTRRALELLMELSPRAAAPGAGASRRRTTPN